MKTVTLFTVKMTENLKGFARDGTFESKDKTRLPLLDDLTISEESVKTYQEGMSEIATEMTNALHESMRISQRSRDLDTRPTDTKFARKNFSDLHDFSASFLDDACASKTYSNRIVTCAACRTDFTQKNYSVNQWTKPSPKCKQCVKLQK